MVKFYAAPRDRTFAAVQTRRRWTLLTLMHEQFSDDESRDNHEKGASSALDKLERFVA